MNGKEEEELNSTRRLLLREKLQECAAALGRGGAAGSPTPWWAHPALVLTQCHTGTCTRWELPRYSNHQIFRYTPRLSRQSYCSREVAPSLLKGDLQ